MQSDIDVKLKDGMMKMKRSKKQKELFYQSPCFYNKVLEEFEESEEKVAYILKTYPYTRNNDTLLMFEYWFAVDNYNGGTVLEEIKGLTSPETIIRIRRMFQNDLRLFLPDDPRVLEARGIKEEAVKEWSVNKEM